SHSEVSHNVNGRSSLFSPILSLTEYHSSILSCHEQIIRESTHSTHEIFALGDECFFDGGITHEDDHWTRSPHCEDIAVLRLSFLEEMMETMCFELMEVSDEWEGRRSFRISSHILIVLVDVNYDQEEYCSQNAYHGSEWLGE
ncbi:hypothetical protein PFISCL1PPCAC_6260, partial [Pristionchus fissidentatus]